MSVRVRGLSLGLLLTCLACKEDADPADDAASQEPAADSGSAADDAGANQADASTSEPGSDATSARDAEVGTLDAGSSSDASRDASSGSDGATKDAAPPGDDAGPATFSTNRDDFGLNGASKCAGSDFLLCEDFEADAIDTKTWSLQTWGKGSASIDSTRAARGKHSVHITEPAESARVVLRETKTFAQTGNHFYGRFFLYLPYVAPALQCNANGDCPNLVHWTALSAGGTYKEGGKDYHPDVRAIGAVNQGLLVNLDGGPKPEVGIDDRNAPAGYTKLDTTRMNQWMCFEFEYVGEGASAEIRVFWDGREHPGLHYSTAQRGDKGELWPIPKYEWLEFGFTHYQNYTSYVQSFEAWLDEIVVDDQRVGCER